MALAKNKVESHSHYEAPYECSHTLYKSWGGTEMTDNELTMLYRRLDAECGRASDKPEWPRV